jgi:O-6-methylguanine DNA methyltransferase
MKGGNNNQPEVYRYVYFKTQLGWIGIAATERGIRALILPQKERKMVTRALRKQIPKDAEIIFDSYYFADIKDAFKQYFSKKEVTFDFPLDINRGNAFERKVWEITRSVPHGKVQTYKWIAERVGFPNAIKSVSSALRYNPLPIIIPCHRIVGSKYGIEYYSRGFEWRKKLLELERDSISRHKARQNK